ncbi:DNA cytosine methyltransferase, partial [Streptomyces daliensis]|nr:DNA cytosine methyltransferase [Streptomyces daliensis]
PSKTVTGANDVHSGTSAVADPRIPEDNETGVFIIISEDGTWHRPLTTLELAVLQGLPTTLPDGRPLILAGKSDARWRERIGNMVPVAAAQAIAETMLRTMLAQEVGEWLMS